MLSVEMPDGSKWGVPIEMIARHRAMHYAHEFGGDVELSLVFDTLPLFESDDYPIKDWVENNMDWSDFTGHQLKLSEAPQPDFQKALMSGAKDVVEMNHVEDKLNMVLRVDHAKNRQAL